LLILISLDWVGLFTLGRPYKKDACGLFILKKASIYAALRPIEKL